MKLKNIKKIIIFGKGPATNIALKITNKLLSKEWKIYFFYFLEENKEFDNLNTAKELNIESIEVTSYRSFSDLIFDINPNFIFLTQCSLIIKKDLINLIGNNLINLHHGKLPEYRGVGPITNAILRGEFFFSITIHVVKEKIDAGPIIHEEKFEIKGLNNEEVYEKCLKYDEIAISKLLKNIQLGNALNFKKQSLEKVAYYSKKCLNYDYPFINFDELSEKLIRFCRAYYFPSRNLYPLVMLNGDIYFSKYMPFLGDEIISLPEQQLNKKQGYSYFKSKDRWIVFKDLILK